MRLGLLKKIVFMDYGHDALICVTKLVQAFNLEIFMSKMHLALIDQSLEKSIKSWKKLRPAH